MDTLNPAAAAAVVAFLAVTAVSPPERPTQAFELVAEPEREAPVPASRPVAAHDLTRELVVEVDVSDDLLASVSIDTHSNVDEEVGFETETVIVNSSGELVSNGTPPLRAGGIHALSARSSESRDLSLMGLAPDLYAIRTVVRGGTRGNLQEQTQLTYVRVNSRGTVEEIEYREWNEHASAAQGEFVRTNDSRETNGVRP